MRRLLLSLALAAVFVLPFAGSAQAVSCVGIGDVTAVGACSDGGLTFSNFGVSTVGFTSAAVFIGNATAGTQVGPTSVDLGFQTSQTPNPVTGLADIVLKYEVAAGSPILTGVNLVNGGSNVIIQEKVCGTAFVGGACASGLLANLIANPDSLNTSVAFADPVSNYFVFKDLQFAGSVDAPAFISDFVNSHEFSPEGPETPPTATPEPGTLLLLGTTLTGLGWAWRKRRG